jgi:penicillin-insensitive murein endopeptidase
LVLLLFGGAVSAEQFKPSHVAPAKQRAATAATPKPTAPKKAATAAKPAPKGPPAKMLFGGADTPAPLAARAIGSYSRGCLSGGVALPIDGPDWQVMRLSRNRNWGHPRLIEYMERLAKDARQDGWPGLLVGDLSQPRGGPMVTGHTSHQVGLDADIWLTPMPDRTLSPQEREDVLAVSMLKDPFNVDPALFTPQHVKLIKRAASYPQVTRIFVHPAIKKALCEQAGKDRAWLSKVRAWWNHYYHFHVRLSCPPGMESCGNQPPVKPDDGCGAELAEWYKMIREAAIWQAIPPDPDEKPPVKKQLSVSDLPGECKAVLNAGEPPVVAEDGTVPAAVAKIASKDAGEPLPHFDPATIEVLKVQVAAAKGKKAPKETAATIAAVTPGGIPLPDRNPAH